MRLGAALPGVVVSAGPVRGAVRVGGRGGRVAGPRTAPRSSSSTCSHSPPVRASPWSGASRCSRTPGPSRRPGTRRSVDAQVAVGRRHVDADQPWSLSPAALLRAPYTPRLVLPSPNGSTIAAAASGLVLAACLRNASAVGRWLAAHGYGTRRVPCWSSRPGNAGPTGRCDHPLRTVWAPAPSLPPSARFSPSLSPEAAWLRAAYLGTADVAAAVRGSRIRSGADPGRVRRRRHHRGGPGRQHRRAGPHRWRLPPPPESTPLPVRPRRCPMESASSLRRTLLINAGVGGAGRAGV